MKVLILGADGMLGHLVKLYFSEQGNEVKGTSIAGRSDYLFDATKNLKDLEKFIKDFQPQAIINCIGLLNQVAENNKALAVLLNSYLPHYVDELARHYKIKFVHVIEAKLLIGRLAGQKILARCGKGAVLQFKDIVFEFQRFMIDIAALAVQYKSTASLARFD